MKIEQGKTVWQLHLKETNEYKFYSSFRALFNDNQSFLNKSRSFFEKQTYPFTDKNSTFSILKGMMKTTGQI